MVRFSAFFENDAPRRSTNDQARRIRMTSLSTATPPNVWQRKQYDVKGTAFRSNWSNCNHGPALTLATAFAMILRGRDAAGKRWAPCAFRHNLNQRAAIGACEPTETGSRTWYFQRYIKHLPTAKASCLFDRSLYISRRFVEPVFRLFAPTRTEAFSTGRAALKNTGGRRAAPVQYFC